LQSDVNAFPAPEDLYHLLSFTACTIKAAGLGIGIAGLAGLFSARLEAIDKVKSYKSFTADADTLNVQYDAYRLTLG
jgi:hypothetical protein